MKISLLLPLSMVLFLHSQLIACAQSAEDDQAQRIQQAQSLIDKNKAFQLHVKQFHIQAKKQRRQAIKLNAQAESVEGEITTTSKTAAPGKTTVNLAQPLQGKVELAKQRQILLETKQCQLDLKQFRQHADLYAAHLSEFDQKMQQVQIEDSQYQISCAEYAKHAQQFHIPGVKAPHICGCLQATQEQTQRLAERFREDQKHVLSAEQALYQQESQLQQAERNRAATERQLLSKTTAQEQLQLEQQIQQEYVRLAEEYRLLQIEQKHVAIKK